MHTPLLSCALLFGSLLPAQTPSPAPNTQAPAAPQGADLAAAKARLANALQKCGQLADTAFQMKWGPDTKKKGDDDPFARMMGAMNSGELKGSWHKDVTHVAYSNENDDELLLAGRRTLAKDGTNDWRLRTGRFADGNTAAFVPDVALLLQQLASWDLAVTHRATGALDDRPVEILSVTLSAEQVAEAIWAGLLPEAITTAMAGGGINIVRLAAAARGAGGGARPAPPAPETTIDLAVFLDPATGIVHQLHFRGWTKEAQAMRAGMVVQVAGGAGGPVRVAGGNANGNDEDEDDDEKGEKQGAAKKDAPLAYENGLPTRPRKKISVCDVVLKLADHGKKEAPPLTDLQKKLLGR